MCILSVWYARRQMFNFSPIRVVQLTHIHAKCFDCATGLDYYCVKEFGLLEDGGTTI